MKRSSENPLADRPNLVWSKEVPFVAADLGNPPLGNPPQTPGFAPLQPLRQWLDNLEIRRPKVARLVCRLIPAQCPFERTIKLGDRTLLQIPPLCKLNPLYDQLVGLRFRALCYLVDQCGEDISRYC